MLFCREQLTLFHSSATSLVIIVSHTSIFPHSIVGPNSKCLCRGKSAVEGRRNLADVGE